MPVSHLKRVAMTTLGLAGLLVSIQSHAAQSQGGMTSSATEIVGSMPAPTVTSTPAPEPTPSPTQDPSFNNCTRQKPFPVANAMSPDGDEIFMAAALAPKKCTVWYCRNDNEYNCRSAFTCTDPNTTKHCLLWEQRPQNWTYRCECF